MLIQLTEIETEITLVSICAHNKRPGQLLPIYMYIAPDQCSVDQPRSQMLTGFQTGSCPIMHNGNLPPLTVGAIWNFLPATFAAKVPASDTQ